MVRHHSPRSLNTQPARSALNYTVLAPRPAVPVTGGIALTWLWVILFAATSSNAATLPPADPDWHIPQAFEKEPGPGSSSFSAPFSAGLDMAIANYQALADSGGWQAIPDGPDLVAGMRDPRVPLLRARLRATGDFSSDMQADPMFMDSGLEAAVRHFQARHGLPENGRMDDRTRKELNVPAADRTTQLAVAAERWRWLPADLGKRFLWVNVPAAVVELIDEGETTLAMRAVVGHPDRPTPSLHSSITQIVFNPTWTVPTTIAREDILPRQQADPDYLARKHIRIYDSWAPGADEISPASIDWQSPAVRSMPFRLVQDPGPWNSLGRVKLVMPNPFDIYIHDTNADYLFDLSARNFSSGCIRLEDSHAMVTALLQIDPSWSSSRVADELSGQATTTAIRLAEPVPVYIVYFTSWVAPDGTVNFRRDVYRRDTGVAAELAMTGKLSAR